MLVLFSRAEDLLKHRPAKGVESRDGEVEDSAAGYVRGLGVHHFADVADLEVDARVNGVLLDGIEVRGFFDANLTGKKCSHGRAF
jgi:hypothetical protein